MDVPRSSVDTKEQTLPRGLEEAGQTARPIDPSFGVALREAVAYAIGEYRKEARQQYRRKILTFLLVIFAASLLVFSFMASAPEEHVRIGDEPIATLPLSGTSGTAHVAVIPVDGPISGDLLDQPSFENTTLYLRDALALIEEKKSVAAVILYVNSPGGDAVASAQGYRLIKEFKQRSKIPVYAFVSRFAYSGGYYLALGGDKIIVDPEASVGSIGVIMKTMNYHRLAGALGVAEVEISTGRRKNAGSSWREFSSEDRAMFQRSVDQIFDRFIRVVSISRKIPYEELRGEASMPLGRTSGATFDSDDAVRNGLADRAETIQELYLTIAKEVEAKKQGFKKIEFVRYDKKIRLLESWKDDSRKGMTAFVRELVAPHASPVLEMRAP